MRRVIALAAAGLSLTGCTSFSSDSFPAISNVSNKNTATSVLQLQLESTPPGADAITSLGPGYKTPCSVALTPPDTGFSTTSEFSVAYTMDNFQPSTVAVQVAHVGGTFSTPATTKINPNPVVAVLQPVAPGLNAARKMLKPEKQAKNKVVHQPALPRTSAAQELERLHGLLVRGVISQTEFDGLKAKLLRSTPY